MATEAELAQLLESRAVDVATRACEDLLGRDRDLASRFGNEAKQLWTEHFAQKVMELSAALSAGNPQLFRDCMQWSVQAMQARALRKDDLEKSVDSLLTALTQQLNSKDLDIVTSYINVAQENITQEPLADSILALDPGIETDRIAILYLQAVVVGNLHSGMDIVIDQVDNGMSVRDAYLKVLLPAQQEVGRLWHMNRLSVAEEHLVTSTTQRLMAVLANKVAHDNDNGLTVIAAAVAGNAHELGIRTIAYLLEFDGWKTIYLGSDVPAVDLPVTVNCFNADLVLLSISLSSQLKSLRTTIEHIRSNARQPVAIMVGGNGFSGAPDLWRNTGADGYAADAQQAVALAGTLVEPPSD